jgi:hypothetical protein
MRIHPAFLPADAQPRRLELVLRLADGGPWRLTVSPGVERFIGAYPRLPDFDVGAPLIAFRTVAAAR